MTELIFTSPFAGPVPRPARRSTPRRALPWPQDRNSGRLRRGISLDHIYIGTPGFGFRRPPRRVRTGAWCERRASPICGRRRLLSGPCLMPFGKGLGGIPETPKGIGVGFGVAAKSMSESRRKFQWMETRKRNHARANLHGSTRQLAWMDSRKCMVGLSEVHGCASGVAWMDFQSAIWAPKRHTQHPAPPKSQPPRQEVLPPPLKLRRTSRVLVPRQVQHPRHSGGGVKLRRPPDSQHHLTWG